MVSHACEYFLQHSATGLSFLDAIIRYHYYYYYYSFEVDLYVQNALYVHFTAKHFNGADGALVKQAHSCLMTAVLEASKADVGADTLRS